MKGFYEIFEAFQLCQWIFPIYFVFIEKQRYLGPTTCISIAESKIFVFTGLF